MTEIPINSSSYPLYVSSKYTPYAELIVRFSLSPTLSEQVNKYINISTDSLSFKSNTYVLNYTINTYDFSNDTDIPSSITLYLSLDGQDSQSYILNTQVVVIKIIPIEYRKPNILAATLVSTDISTATFSLFTDIKGFIFYIYADQHMPDPTFEFAQSRVFNQTLNYSNPLFGLSYVRTDDFNVNFTLQNLIQNHDYEVFIFVMNMNQVINPVHSKIYFKTLG